MNLLVLAPEPVDADTVREALGDGDLDDARVLVISPALNESPFAFWTSDADEAIAEAQETADQSAQARKADGVRPPDPPAQALKAAAVQATGRTGESEPLLALQDALATFEADRILVFVHQQD